MRGALLDYQIRSRLHPAKPGQNKGLTHGEQSLAVLQIAYESLTSTSLTSENLGWISLPEHCDILYQLLKAVDKLISKEVKVICLPLGFARPNPLLESMTETCRQHDILLIVPAGNKGAGKVTYPGANPHVLTVGAADPKGTVETYSGTLTDQEGCCIKPEVLAEGFLISDFNHMSKGTSIACAKVAGLAVALLETNPELSAPELKSLICLRSRPAAGSRYGLVDMENAMEPIATHQFAKVKSVASPSLDFTHGWVDWSLESQCKRATRSGNNLRGLISMINMEKQAIFQDLNDSSVTAYEPFNHFNVIYIDAQAAVFEKLFRHPDLLWASAVDVNYFDLISE